MKTVKNKNPSIASVFPILMIVIAALLYYRSSTHGGPPNVVFMTLDTTRADHIAAFGGDIKTPVLDSIAADGAIFTNDATAAIATTPSHATLLTSKYPYQHQVQDNVTPLPEDLLTIPQVLKKQGYDTAAFVSAVPVSGELGFDKKFDYFDDEFDPEMGGGERRAQNTINSALTWLKKKRNKPFFIWIHLYDAHTSYNPPSEFRNLYMDVDSAMENCDDPLSFQESISEKQRIKNRADDDRKPQDFVVARKSPEPGGGCLMGLEEGAPLMKALYKSEITYMDGQIGVLLSWFKKKRLYNNTLFVITADHGEVQDEDVLGLKFRHNMIYEGVMHVPLIVKLPGRHKKKIVVDAPVSSLDVAPTILEAIKVESPPEFPLNGVSVLKLTRGLKDDSFANREVYFQAPGKMAAGVKQGGLKYIFIYDPRKYFKFLDSRPPEQAFNLASDPSETNNLSGTPDERDFRELMVKLKDWKQNANKVEMGIPEPRKNKDEKFLKKLKELGYF